MRKIFLCFLLVTAISGLTVYGAQVKKNTPTEGANPMLTKYHFPSEDKAHEGTWMTWPHHYTYGIKYREEIESIWLEMAAALHTGEMIHIIAYDEAEQCRITKLLQAEQIDVSRVDFVIAKSDDVWARDTGPMFVLDENQKMFIADFAFDGWGGKMAYQNDDKIPQAVAAARRIPILPIPDFVLEGGSVELDGSGTAMLCKSSVVSESRNPNMSIAQAEAYLKQYLGATNFIWLEGVQGEDITDAHIDGTARFYDHKTLLTVSKNDFLKLYDSIQKKDYETLRSAKNSVGEPYEIIELPMTANNVSGLDYKGSYLNYYVGNKVILVPVYGDVNDATATEILSKLYSDREIIPIHVAALYQHGGMLHCITQQQPRHTPRRHTNRVLTSQ